MSQHVVLLEAGGKQAFIFGTNKQAVNVGASDLIRSLGEGWVREATAQVAQGRNTQDWELVYASGKAMLVAPDADSQLSSESSAATSPPHAPMSSIGDNRANSPVWRRWPTKRTPDCIRLDRPATEA